MARFLTLMGSGETSPTMVKTHRSLVAAAGDGPAVLLDTPFGFQSNADELTARAQQYFAESVGTPLDVVSYRVEGEAGSTAHEGALAKLRSAAYVFAGPGSPTYALRLWRTSLVPALLAEKVRPGGTGGAVTFASAAALTLGVTTVPVYEIYKVGTDPVWAEGLDLVGEATGGLLRAAVIPHFNNAEGGTHDTRFCYLGEGRLATMEQALPDGAFVLGIDEHTGLVMDLDAGSASVVGIGVVTLRWPDGATRILESGSVVAIESLAAHPTGIGRADSDIPVPARPEPESAAAAPSESPLLASVREAETAFDEAIAKRDVDAAVQAVLDFEAVLHEWANETFSGDEMGRARGALRGMVARLGEAGRTGLRDPSEAIAPFVDALLDLRRSARADKRFADADAVRDVLVELGIEVRDTPGGTEWQLA